MFVNLKLFMSIALTVFQFSYGQNHAVDGVGSLNISVDDVKVKRTSVRMTAATATITPNKGSLYQGEEISFALVSQGGATFFRNDYILIKFSITCMNLVLAMVRLVQL
jgi:hypothetical protein